jgi:hypothetical protein
VRPLVVGKLPTTPRPRLSQCDPKRSSRPCGLPRLRLIGER